VGPRGSGYGHQLRRDWMARAGLTLEIQRTFAREKTVVMAQHGIRFARFDDLESALKDGDLAEVDELK